MRLFGHSTMVRDRLAELCANKRNDSGKNFLQDINQRSSSKKVKDVLDEAEKIREMINILQDNISIVKDLHNNVLSHTDLGIQNELESRTFVISQTAFRIRTSLKDLGKDVARVDELTLESARDGPVYMRIKFLQYTTILRMFSDIMHAYNESLLRYHDKCSSLLHQQRILLRKETASQVFDLGDNDEKTNLFVDNILEESRLAKLQLTEITFRHNEILKLEKSIKEIRDMFLEIAFSVEKQGEQLNCVEYFAGKATDDVEGGRSDLTKAEKKRHRNRKRKTKIFVVLGIIIAILLLIAIFL
ncbi:syntaxin isoform X2 [Microplitis demolitor]|uniref:syntaxin isoform X2 n=1 Tax=Microplitis demolitor TaxID=69319 RepID=UPI0004CCAC5A|nr:syntaxin isoform X2 [Microplitis demolitor]